MKKLIQGKKNFIILLVVVAGLFALAASWTLAKSNGSTPLAGQNTMAARSGNGTVWSKAVFSVDKLSCGACVDNPHFWIFQYVVSRINRDTKHCFSVSLLNAFCGHFQVSGLCL